MSDYLQALNKPQREAVVNYEGASLIVAGAGSGKTRVLTTRIAYMLEQGVAPHTILALTFTNKAAEEMRERISRMVGAARARYIWMGTFHSVFARILRAEADKLGYPRDFTIYDTADSKNLLKVIMKELDLSDETYKPSEILGRISMAKNNLVTPQSYQASATLVGEDRERRKPAISAVYELYARRCKENGAMDFDDLLLNMNILLRDFPDVLEKYQQMFRYILVDEYQDTNHAQYIIIRRLAALHGNICVVGDDAQSIYSFRGARIENILRFRNDFPDAKTFKLEQNYRSTRNIVNAANSVIEKNTDRIDKRSFSEGIEGEKIRVVRTYTDQEEAAVTADTIRSRARRDGAAWSDFAVLYRTNAQSRVLEEALRRRSIPYKIYGGISFYQRKEVKDVVAYIKLIVNPRDNEALRRIINYPARGLGDVTVGRIAEAASREGVSMWEMLTRLTPENSELKGAAAKKATEFRALIEGLSLERETMDLYEFGMAVATRSGIIGLYKMENSPEAMSALENIQELLNSMQAFAQQRAKEAAETGGQAVAPSVTEWLQDVSLLTDMDNEKPEDRDKVTLMTVQSAKGLEFRYLFIVGLEENLFPNLMGMGTREGLEEERRLFYVALTRAREAATVSFAQTRFKWGSMEFCRPSRFLGELAPEYLDIDFELDGAATADTRPDADTQRFGGGYRGDYQRREGGYPGSRPGAPSGAAKPYPPRPATIAPPQPVAVPRPDARFHTVGTRPAETSAPLPAGVPATAGAVAVGTRVEHAKFGTGTVAAIEPMAGDLKYTIAFDNPAMGTKTLLSKFAKLNII